MSYFYTGGRAHVVGQPTLVFIHGAQHDHSVWILQSRYFAHHGFNVIAIDLPGHGRSFAPLQESVETMAQAVLALLDELAVDSATLVGHSMGSLIALELAGLMPNRTNSLALLGTSAPMKVSDALLALIARDEARAMEQINQWSHSTLAQKPGNPGPGFSTYIQNIRLMQRQKSGVLLTDFSACNNYQKGLARAQEFAKPCLIIQGQHDQMTPVKAAKKLQAAFAHPAQLEIIENSGHAVMSERPDAVLSVLNRWLQSSVVSSLSK